MCPGMCIFIRGAPVVSVGVTRDKWSNVTVGMVPVRLWPGFGFRRPTMDRPTPRGKHRSDMGSSLKQVPSYRVLYCA